jgi:hypothetical protein
MTATKSVKIFDKIRGKLEPILIIEDLELSIYHPNILAKEVSLAIFDSQITVDYLNDLVIQKSTQLAELRDVKTLDAKNLQKRKDLTKEISGLNDQIDSEICIYIEQLSKLKPGSLAKKLEAVDFSEEYPREKLVSDIFAEINTALREHNKQEYKIEETEEAGKDL